VRIVADLLHLRVPALVARFTGLVFFARGLRAFEVAAPRFANPFLATERDFDFAAALREFAFADGRRTIRLVAAFFDFGIGHSFRRWVFR
jgi:hypothetical protein